MEATSTTKDSTESAEPGNSGIGFPNFLAKVEGPENAKTELAAELANGRLAMMASWEHWLLGCSLFQFRKQYSNSRGRTRFHESLLSLYERYVVLYRCEPKFRRTQR